MSLCSAFMLVESCVGLGQASAHGGHAAAADVGSAMQVSMQQSAMDARTGMIDMDKIYSGVGAIDRETRKHLAVMISELLVSTRPPLSPPCVNM